MGCSGALMHELNQPRVLQKGCFSHWLLTGTRELWPLRIFKLLTGHFSHSVPWPHCTVLSRWSVQIMWFMVSICFPSRTGFGHCSQSPGTVTVTTETVLGSLVVSLLHSAKSCCRWDDVSSATPKSEETLWSLWLVTQLLTHLPHGLCLASFVVINHSLSIT